MAREINLVPDIKNEMIKALKLRNLIFFICIVVAAISAVVTLILGVSVGGQRLALESKDKDLSTMSGKVNSYEDLKDFLIIKDQVGKLSDISKNKKLLSRTFGILSAFLPTGPDTITISELTIDLAAETPTFKFEAQANAGQDPFIDYNVLDAFKKSMPYMKYDYGRYVDKNGNEIPEYCIIETGSDGAMLSNLDKEMYAFWEIDKEGCNPATENEESKTNNGSVQKTDNYEKEDYEGKSVVRIWRTPQFTEWVDKKFMTLEGQISGVPHFESSCIKYTGEKTSSTIKWTETNDSCSLIPVTSDGIIINESSNGRNSAGELVLRFSSTIELSPEVYKFSNKHMLALPPSGKYNVTDSYVQVQKMFSEKAADCSEDDPDCKTAKER